MWNTQIPVSGHLRDPSGGTESARRQPTRQFEENIEWLVYVCVQYRRTTKTIRVSEELRTRIKAHSREGETLNETLYRLLRGPALRELAGILSDGEAETFEESHRAHDEEIERRLDEMG